MSPERKSEREKEKKPQVGRLLIAGEINEEIFKNAAPVLLDQIEDPKIKKIVITLTTGGGQETVALGFYDIIKNSPKPVEIIGVGRVMSAGMMILSAASRRYATENTQFMFHPGGKSFEKVWLTAVDLKIHTEDLEKGDELAFKIIAERSGTNLGELRRKFSPVRYLSAQEAKEENLIDDIVSSPLELLKED